MLGEFVFYKTMDRMVLLAAVIIVLIHSALTEPLGPAENLDELSVDRLCRSKKVDLIKMSQFESLFKPPSLYKLLNTCPGDLKSMITHFQTVTRQANDNACSMETVQAFKEYYVKLINKSRKAPSWWKRFVIAYGMQLSNLCKENALNVLTKDEHAQLREEDVSRLGVWASDHSPLNPILESMNEPGTFIMPTDFIALTSRKTTFVPETMYIQLKDAKGMKLYKEVCQKRFQPVYEQLMMPLTVLSSIGFYYMREEQLFVYKKEDRENSRVHDKWTNILFVCEALKLVEFVEYLEPDDVEDEMAPLYGPLQQDDMQSTAHNQQSATNAKQTKPKRKWWQLCRWGSKAKVSAKDHGVIKLLTKEEADVINQKYEKLRAQLDRRPDEDIIEQLKPKFLAVQMNDLVLDRSDKKLMNAVGRSKSRMRKIKGRLQRKALLTLRRELKAGKVNVLASGSTVEKWESLKSKSHGNDVSKSVVTITEKMADNAIEHEKKWSTRQIVMFVVVLIVALAALAVVMYFTLGAAALAYALGTGLAASLAGRK